MQRNSMRFVVWCVMWVVVVLFDSYRVRIEATLLKEEFSNTVDWIRPCLDAVILTAKGFCTLFNKSCLTNHCIALSILYISCVYGLSALILCTVFGAIFPIKCTLFIGRIKCSPTGPCHPSCQQCVFSSAWMTICLSVIYFCWYLKILSKTH